MSLSIQQKSSFYRELGQLARSGKPFAASLQLLIENTRGAVRDLLLRIKASVDGGATVGDAFVAQHPDVSHLESSIISASSRSGQLEKGSLYLSEYYDQLSTARKTLIRKLLYPIFLLHAGIFVTGLPSLVIQYATGSPGAAVTTYLKGSFGALIVVYLATFACWMAGRWLIAQGSKTPGVDGFLRRIPLVGKLRRAYALGRFCSTYEMQLQSGVNVMDSLASAGKASQSALVNATVRRAVPLVRDGAQVGPLLKGNNAFTEEMVRSIQIGEETGELDAELIRLAANFRTEAVTRLDFLCAFLFKAIYIGVAVYVGIRLIFGYLGYMDATVHSIDSMGL